MAAVSIQVLSTDATIARVWPRKIVRKGNSRETAARRRIASKTGVSFNHRRRSIAIKPKAPPITNGMRQMPLAI
jgi:hypothetical protein